MENHMLQCGPESGSYIHIRPTEARKDLQVLMEYPFFSLSTKPDMRRKTYRYGDIWVEARPFLACRPTLMDKGPLVYIVSGLMDLVNKGAPISPWVEFTAHEALKFLGWQTNGQGYRRIENALERLAGTLFRTNLETGGQAGKSYFELIEDYQIVRGTGGRMEKVRVKVSEWVFRGVRGPEVLTINAQYFKLRRPLERRLYELARKHVGDPKQSSKPFQIRPEKLQKKIGSSASPKGIRFDLKTIIETGGILDFDMELLGKNVVMKPKKPDPEPPTPYQGIWLPSEPSVDLIRKARNVLQGEEVMPVWDVWRETRKQQPEPPRSIDADFLAFCKRWVESLQASRAESDTPRELLDRRRPDRGFRKIDEIAYSALMNTERP